MPKRKAKFAPTPDESPPRKKRKNIPERADNKHGRKKASNSGPGSRPRGISANWKALSMSIGVSPGRKKDQSADKKGATAAAKGRKREGDRRRQTKGRDTHAKGISGSEIWFDDIPLESINMELGASSSKKASVSLITGLDKSGGRCVGLDCEMVGTGPDGSYSMLARVCLVNHHGHTLYDSFVAPMDRIADYRTAVSGVTQRDLRGAPEFSVVQKQVSDMLKDRILVGHSVQNDLKALLLSHPKKETRDTSKYRPFKNVAKTRYPSLKKLAKEILGLDIQSKEHSPVEDAQVAMKLYQLHKKEWEASIRARLTKREICERKREKRKREKDAKLGFRVKPPQTLTEPFNIMLHTDDR